MIQTPDTSSKIRGAYLAMIGLLYVSSLGFPEGLQDLAQRPISEIIRFP